MINLKQILPWIIAAGLGAVLIYMLTRKAVKTEQMIRNEVALEYMEKDRLKDSVRYEKDIARYDSLLTASNDRYEQLETRKIPIQYAIKNVPVIVSNYDREQLRRSFTNPE